MTTVYVVLVEQFEFGSLLIAVCASKETANKHLLGYVEGRIKEGAFEPGENYSTLSDTEKIGAYFDYWTEDSYEITKMEVRP